MESSRVIRDIYVSDLILMDEENELLNQVDDTYLDLMEEILNDIVDHKVELTEDKIRLLEKKFTEFYFEYGYVQFKRGLELGLSMRDIH